MINGIPVIVGIATIEARKDSLGDTLNSLQVQADEIWVHSNDYLMTAEMSARYGDNIYLTGFGSCLRDLGDVGKFYAHMPGNYPDGLYYALTCDDDLIYPPDYVETLIAAIERGERQEVCGFHGRQYYGPVDSYYRSLGAECKAGRAKVYRLLDDCFESPSVTIIGTGAMGWHSSVFEREPLCMDDFEAINMSDIFFSAKCNGMAITRRVVPHESGWIRHTDKIDTQAETICSRHWNDDKVQTDAFNSIPWRL